MGWLVFAAYLLGGSLGYAASRSDALGRLWPRLVRANLLVASVALAVMAAWRLQGLADVLWPLLMIAVIALMYAVALLTTRGDRRGGRATLRVWSAIPNSGFFAIPISAVLVGPAGTLVAVLLDRIGAPLWAVWVWMLRRDAPRPQRARTSWIDQSPLIALAVGLVLRATVAPPDWTLVVSQVAAPFMAATGAAIFVGSVLHRSQRISPRPGVRTWLAFSAMRVVLFAPLVVLAPTVPIAVVTVLCALTIPPFGPPQFSTLYGYADPVVAASARFGWIVGAVGLVVACAMSR